MKKLAVIAALSASTILTGALPAFAEYPTAPVQFVVPWPPGDFEDILTRMIAANMEKMTGVSASVVNKPGGGDGSEKSRIHADTARSMSGAYEVALYQSRQPPRITPSELT